MLKEARSLRAKTVAELCTHRPVYEEVFAPEPDEPQTWEAYIGECRKTTTWIDELQLLAAAAVLQRAVCVC
jgi:hypothetical protein